MMPFSEWIEPVLVYLYGVAGAYLMVRCLVELLRRGIVWLIARARRR